MRMKNPKSYPDSQLIIGRNAAGNLLYWDTICNQYWGNLAFIPIYVTREMFAEETVDYLTTHD